MQGHLGNFDIMIGPAKGTEILLALVGHDPANQLVLTEQSSADPFQTFLLVGDELCR